MSKKSFIDEELPQIRVPEQYTKGKLTHHHDHHDDDDDAGHTKLLSMNEVVPQAQQQLLLPESLDNLSMMKTSNSASAVTSSSNATDGITSNGNHDNVSLVVAQWHVGLMSFLVGVFFTLIALRFQDRIYKSSRRSNYERIPDMST